MQLKGVGGYESANIAVLAVATLSVNHIDKEQSNDLSTIDRIQQ